MTKDPLLSLSQLHGEGRVTCRALQAAGFLTLRSVASASLQQLSDRAHLSARSASRLQAGAREMIANGADADAPTSAPRPRGGRRARTGPRRTGSRRSPLSAPLTTLSEGVTEQELRLLRGEETAASAPKPAPRA